MVQRAAMDYKIDILSEGYRSTSVYPLASGVSVEEGDTVTFSATGFIRPTAATRKGGLVIRGDVDDKSVKASGKPVVLLGNAIVRLSSSKVVSFGTLSLLDPVDLTATGIAEAASDAAAWGHVIEIGSDYIVIDVK